MCLRPLLLLAVAASLAATAGAQSTSPAAAIDAYLQPYVRTENFSGVVLVEQRGKIIFEKAYGFADREHRIPNTPDTRFHIASLSMQFTAAAALRLADSGAIRLEEHIAGFVPGLEGADKITIRDLLTERSGLPDINSLPDYDEVLQHHQTPSSLVARIAGKPLLFEPGTKFLHEEHSAYNLLALIIEKKTGLAFAAAVGRLVFQPLGLADSGVDDDALSRALPVARGYEPEGAYGLEPARAIHWSAKTGNASAYTTARDEARWIAALFRGRALGRASREAVLDISLRVGYGWFKGEDKRFGEVAYYMNGRAPGFASFVLYLPRAQTTVVVLGNIYSSATTAIGYDVAAASLGLPYEELQLRDPAPGPAELKTCVGTFQFGPDFYQPSAKVTLVLTGQELSLIWPSGDASSLIPVARDRFLDRAYWQEVRLERDAAGKPAALVYDRFQGTASRPE